MDACTLLLASVIFLAKVLTSTALSSVSSSTSAGQGYRLKEKCPLTCRCLPLWDDKSINEDYNRRWRLNVQSYVWSGWRWEKRTKNAATANEVNREMICRGIRAIPGRIPKDVRKLKISGRRHQDDTNVLIQRDQRRHWHHGRRRNYVNRWRSSGASDVLLDIDTPKETTLERLRYLPLDNLHELSIEGTEIDHVSTIDFQRMGNLKSLRISDNGLREIEYSALDPLGKLQNFDVSRNRLRIIPHSLFQDTGELETLDLSHNSLEFLAGETLSRLQKLQKLDVSSNRLTTLPPAILAGIGYSARTIDLGGNNITFIDRRWFDHVTAVETLSIRNNRLTELPDYMLAFAKRLQQLDLSANLIQHIGDRTLRGLASLQKLDLSRNQLYFVGKECFRDLKRLRVLQLRRNKLKDIPTSVRVLRLLDVLDMSWNRVSQLDEQLLATLPRLRKLDMSHNHLKQVSTYTFRGMTNLQELRLENNKIRVLEDDAFLIGATSHESRLTWLYLQKNQIESIGRFTLFGTPYMKYLNLDQNRLTYLHQNAFSSMRNLQTLLMAANFLNELTKTHLRELTQLRHLSVRLNSMHGLSRDVFFYVQQLETLDLSANEITHLPLGVFRETNRLSRIYLNKNMLQVANLSDFISSIPRLRYLNLDRNEISAVYAQVPSSFSSSLHYLNLGGNKLKDLTSNVTRLMRAHSQLHLEDNPWRCDCELRWIRNAWTAGKIRIKNEEKLRCKSPTYFAGRQVTKLSREEVCSVPQRFEMFVEKKVQTTLSVPRYTTEQPHEEFTDIKGTAYMTLPTPPQKQLLPLLDQPRKHEPTPKPKPSSKYPVKKLPSSGKKAVTTTETVTAAQETFATSDLRIREIASETPKLTAATTTPTTTDKLEGSTSDSDSGRVTEKSPKFSDVAMCTHATRQGAKYNNPVIKKNGVIRFYETVVSWHANVLRQDGTIACQGARIRRDWIITPKDCWTEYTKTGRVPKEMTVEFGVFDTTKPKEPSTKVGRVYMGDKAALLKIHAPEQAQKDSEALYPCIPAKQELLKTLQLLPKGIITGASALQTSRAAVMTYARVTKGNDCPRDLICVSPTDQSTPSGAVAHGSPLVLRRPGRYGWTLYGIQINTRTNASPQFQPITALVEWIDSIVDV